MTPSQEAAKQFLIDRVLDQARLDGISLAEIEVFMLGFAQDSADEKEKEAAAVFERDHDDGKYESKIAELLRRVYKRDVESGRKEEWDRSLDDLADQDLYLFVMLEKAGLVKTTTILTLPSWRFLLVFVPVLVFIVFVFLALFLAFSPWGERAIPNSSVRIGICILLLLAPVLWNMLKRKRTG